METIFKKSLVGIEQRTWTLYSYRHLLIQHTQALQERDLMHLIMQLLCTDGVWTIVHSRNVQVDRANREDYRNRCAEDLTVL